MGASPEAQQFAQFLGSVSAKASTPGLDLAVIRDIVETNHRASAEPEGVTYAEVDAGGVPALWCIPEDAHPDRALLHFHFGGSVTASMHSDRKAAGHIAKAAGARSLVVDFRLAPEHPHPAQLDDAETAYRWLLSQGYEPRTDYFVDQLSRGLARIAAALHPKPVIVRIFTISCASAASRNWTGEILTAILRCAGHSFAARRA